MLIRIVLVALAVLLVPLVRAQRGIDPQLLEALHARIQSLHTAIEEVSGGDSREKVTLADDDEVAQPPPPPPPPPPRVPVVPPIRERKKFVKTLKFTERVERFLPKKPYLTVWEVEEAEREIMKFEIHRPVLGSVSAEWIPLEFKHWKRYCPDNCELQWRQDEAADIVWRGERQPPTRKHPDQLIVGNQGEAYTGTGAWYWSSIRPHVDWDGTYRQGDVFYMPWFAIEWAPPQWNVSTVSDVLRLMMSPDPSACQRRSSGAPVVFAHNNCAGHRGDIFRALAASSSVAHSVGSCAHNYDEPPSWRQDRLHFWPNNEGFHFVQKAWMAQKYLTMCAMENTLTEDYFTEKRFQALLGGAVPIVFKNDNSVQHLPHPDAAIFVDDFPNTAALIDYLMQLMDPEQGDLLLKKHYYWKRRGIVSRDFVRMLFHGFSFVGCRLCEAVSQVETMEIPTNSQ